MKLTNRQMRTLSRAAADAAYKAWGNDDDKKSKRESKPKHQARILQTAYEDVTKTTLKGNPAAFEDFFRCVRFFANTSLLTKKIVTSNIDKSFARYVEGLWTATEENCNWGDQEAIALLAQDKGVEFLPFEGMEISSLRFVGQDLKFRFLETPLEKVTFNGSRLYSLQIERSPITKGRFKGASLLGAETTGAWIRSSNVTKTSFKGAHMPRFESAGATYKKVDFRGAVLTDSKWIEDSVFSVGTKLTKVNFTNAKMDGSNISGAELTDVKFNNALMYNVHISDTTFRGRSSFRGANLEGMVLENVVFGDPEDKKGYIDLRGVDLTGIDFKTVDFLGRVKFNKRTTVTLDQLKEAEDPDEAIKEYFRVFDKKKYKEIYGGRKKKAEAKTTKVRAKKARPAKDTGTQASKPVKPKKIKAKKTKTAKRKFKGALMTVSCTGQAIEDKVSFKKGNRLEANYSKSTFEKGAKFDGTELHKGNFSFTTFRSGVSFKNADLTNADLSGCIFNGHINFQGADLTNADFTGAVFAPGCTLDLRGAILSNTEFLGTILLAQRGESKITGVKIILSKKMGDAEEGYQITPSQYKQFAEGTLAKFGITMDTLRGIGIEVDDDASKIEPAALAKNENLEIHVMPLVMAISKAYNFKDTDDIKRWANGNGKKEGGPDNRDGPDGGASAGGNASSASNGDPVGSGNAAQMAMTKNPFAPHHAMGGQPPFAAGIISMFTGTMALKPIFI